MVPKTSRVNWRYILNAINSVITANIIQKVTVNPYVYEFDLYALSMLISSILLFSIGSLSASLRIMYPEYAIMAALGMRAD